MQAQTATGPAAPTASSSTLQREVFGFAPYWTLSQESSWNYSLLSTVAYFGLTVNNDGTINQTDQGWTGWNSSDLTDMISRAHAAGDRVVVAIKANSGPVSTADTVNSIVTNTGYTTTAISAAISDMNAKGLDGINVDFEGSSTGYPNVQAGFTSFMRQLRAAAPSPLQVTAATYAGSASWNDGLFRIDDLAQYVDAFFVMAYDMNFANMRDANNNDHAGPTAPLSGMWTYNDTLTVQQYVAKAGASKVILGVPYYGYASCTADRSPYSQLTYQAPQPNETVPCQSHNPTAASYSTVQSDFACMGPVNQFSGRLWDGTASAPWASWWSPSYPNDPCQGNHNSSRELYYDDATSLGLKYDLVNSSNIRGTGIWALGFDGSSPDLWNELYLKMGPWRTWQSLGGQLTSGPDAASWASGRLDVFARGTDNALWHKWWDGTSWSAWERQGGQLSADPGAVSWGPNRIDVFVRGTDDQLWHKWWDGRAWSGWEPLGGVLKSGPDVASWGNGRLDVFVRGTDDMLWHKWFDGGWSAWEPLGGQMTSDPSAVSAGANTIDVFYRAGDNTLWHRKWNGSSWSAGESLGGALTGSPDAASWGGGRLDVFVRGSDLALYHYAYDGTAWAPSQRLGGYLTSDPGAVSWGVNRIDVFARGGGNDLWHIWYQSG